MIPILTHSDGITIGLGETEFEARRGRDMWRQAFARVGFFQGEPPESDLYDQMNPFTFLVKWGDEIIGACRYLSGGQGFPIYDAFRLALPEPIAAIPENRRLDGNRLGINSKLPIGLTSGGLLAAAFLFFGKHGGFDVSLHCTHLRWANLLIAHGIKYNEISDCSLIYPRNKLMEPYYYNTNPELKIRPYYCLIQENQEFSHQMAHKLGFAISPGF